MTMTDMKLYDEIRGLIENLNSCGNTMFRLKNTETLNPEIKKRLDVAIKDLSKVYDTVDELIRFV